MPQEGLACASSFESVIPHSITLEHIRNAVSWPLLKPTLAETQEVGYSNQSPLNLQATLMCAKL